MDRTISRSKEGIAIDGYDPVAYFVLGQARKGLPEFSHAWQGASWRFTSAAHLALFAAHPERYAPQFGGHCAFAVSLGKSAPGSPTHWGIVNGKLYLALNPVAKLLWRLIPGRRNAAHRNWAAK